MLREPTVRNDAAEMNCPETLRRIGAKLLKYPTLPGIQQKLAETV
jgi:hypothetical protein